MPIWISVTISGCVNIWVMEGFRSECIVYSVSILVLELNFLFLIFEKLFYDLKNVCSICTRLPGRENDEQDLFKVQK